MRELHQVAHQCKTREHLLKEVVTPRMDLDVMIIKVRSLRGFVKIVQVEYVLDVQLENIEIII